MSPIRVLHVEDEPDIREIVEISLGLDPNFESKSCSSGEEALSFIRDWTPDLILLDVMMPAMDGPATLARLRENVETASIPVVFMTARAQTREIEHFRSLGAAGVIPKPFDAMTLAASVRTYISADIQLAHLHDAFMQRLNDDATAIKRHRTALMTGMLSPIAFSELKDIAHGLAGAGGIFGFSEISSLATALEDATVMKFNGPSSVEQLLRPLDKLLHCIERVSANEISSTNNGHSAKKSSN